MRSQSPVFTGNRKKEITRDDVDWSSLLGRLNKLEDQVKTLSSQVFQLSKPINTKNTKKEKITEPNKEI